MNIILDGFFLGLLSTLIMDIIALIRKNLLQKPSFNYAFIGRWFLSLKNFKFLHNNISTSPSIRYEKIFGWIFHYIIGILLGILYLITLNFIDLQNILIQSLGFGLLTALLPLCIMQPLLGFGFFAYKTPNQAQSIKNSLIAHFNFGCGLFVSHFMLVQF